MGACYWHGVGGFVLNSQSPPASRRRFRFRLLRARTATQRNKNPSPPCQGGGSAGFAKGPYMQIAARQDTRHARVLLWRFGEGDGSCSRHNGTTTARVPGCRTAAAAGASEDSPSPHRPHSRPCVPPKAPVPLGDLGPARARARARLTSPSSLSANTSDSSRPRRATYACRNQRADLPTSHKNPP